MTKPQTPEQLNNHGQAAFRRKDFLVAAQAFLAAASVYQEQSDQAKYAEMRNNASVAFLQAGDAQQALLSAQDTDQIFAQIGDPYKQALALGNQAAAYEAMGDSNQALTLYQKSAVILKGSEYKAERAAVLKAISALEIRSGDKLRALASMQAALDVSPRLSFKERALKKLLDIPMQMLKR